MQLRPNFAEAATNLGTALTAQNRLHDGIAAYRAALALRPRHANTEFALSLALLLNGEFAEGWCRFEARRETSAMAANYQRRLDVPRCRPQDLLSLSASCSVLLLAEQGLGDIIQFVRYAPMLVQRGLRVIVEAPTDLHTLFGSMAGVALVSPNDPTPECNAACFLLSLPLAFGTDLASIPADVPYLHVRAQRHEARRIGFVISGDAAHPHDRHRSIPLATLVPLLATPGFQFVIAQRDIRDTDRAVMAEH